MTSSFMWGNELPGLSGRRVEFRALRDDDAPLERQGLRREGYLRERWHHLGEVRDGVLLGLLRREWTGGAVAGSGP